jgi:hypothetical protein
MNNLNIGIFLICLTANQFAYARRDHFCARFAEGHKLVKFSSLKLFSPIVAVLLIILPTVSMSVEPGIYYCMTERLVGIQPEIMPGSIDKEDMNAVYEWKKSNRVAGNLKPAKE